MIYRSSMISTRFFGVGNYQLIAPPVLTGAPAGFSENAVYTGVSANSDLLSAASVLQPGEQFDITFSVLVVNPFAGSSPGEFLNQASVSARSPADAQVFDLSGDGASLDVDSDEPTPVVLNTAIRLSGLVFEDSSETTATNHDAIRQSMEPGLANQRIEVRHGSDGSLLETAISDASGYWEVLLPTTLAGIPVDIVLALDSAHTVVSEVSAYSGGSVRDGWLRIDVLSLQHYDDLAIGLVSTPSLEAATATSAPPGTPLQFAHTYRAPTSGVLSWSLSLIATPVSPQWPASLIGDDNCNGVWGRWGDGVVWQSRGHSRSNPVHPAGCLRAVDGTARGALAGADSG